MLHRIKMNLGRVILAAVLAVAFVALLLVYIANDRAYVPPEDALGTRVSVEAFSKGYDAVVEELTMPPEPQPEIAEEALLFSLDELGTAFFSKTTELTITPKQGGQIYYTLDGTDPRHSESSTYYNQVLELKPGISEPLVYRVKAAVLYGVDNWSEVCSRIYFVGKNIDDQFNIPVYSIELPEEHLWSRETGIFHTQNQNQHGVEWERAMHVQLFDSDGSLIFNMPGGIRIYGGYSRAHIMKSMRITARKRYSTVLEDFNSLDLFGAMYDAEGVRIDRFEDIVIRNTGNDFGRAHLRDELIQVVMRKQGFAFTESVRPCLVYLNGELYGFFWMHEPYKESYFETRFGMYDYQGDFVVLDGPERAKVNDEEYLRFDPLEDYNAMLALGEKDLTDDANYEALCRVLDVESYLQMHATMAYVDNGDWPQNNNRVFKYFAMDGEDFSDVYGMDGKWYFVPHDTDWCLSNNVNNNTLYRNYDPSVIQYSPLFCHLMERQECRDIYVTYFLDMMNDQFKPATMRQTLFEIADSIRAGMKLYLQESPYIPSNFGMKEFDQHVDQIEKYVMARANVVHEHLKEMYDLGKKYTLTVEVPGGAGVQINTIRNEGYFKGTYYSEYPTVISPIIPAGYEFDHWEINGMVSLVAEKVIPYSDAETGKVNVKLFLRSAGTLNISEIGYTSGEDYIVLTNYGKEPVSTLGYALTDNAALPARFRLPVMTVQPGESVVIYGKNYDPTVALRQLQLDFNFSSGETVTLIRTDASTMQDEIIDRVRLPRLHEGYVYVRDVYEDRFYEMTSTAFGEGE